MDMSPRPREGVDGRLSRTLRSRQAICEACLDLAQDGVLQPSADEIAERAGLSRRSIFNHFRDLAELYDAVAEAGMQRCAPLLRKISDGEPISRRVELFVDARSKFLDAAAPFTRSLTAQVLVGPAGEQAWRVSQDAIRLHRQEIERLFLSEIADAAPTAQPEIIDAMSAATSPLNWEFLRRSQGLSLPKARAVMLRSLKALLRDAGVELP